jgi:hypothetical protein
MTSKPGPAKVRPDPLIPFRVLTDGWHHASYRDHNGGGPPAPLAGVCVQGTGSPRREVFQRIVRRLDRAHHGGQHIVAPWHLGVHRRRNIWALCCAGCRIGGRRRRQSA